MKRTIAVFALALGMTLGFSPHASAQQDTVVVTVPFDFSIGGRVLPQGEYHIATDGGFLSIRDSEQKTHRFLRGVPGDASKDGRSVLVFDNVDGNYFLRKIATGRSNMNMEFSESTLERNTRNSEHSRSIFAENSGR
jgi:hypothetical protein